MDKVRETTNQLLKRDLIAAGREDLAASLTRLEEVEGTPLEPENSGDTLMMVLGETIGLQREGKIQSTADRDKEARRKLGLTIRVD